MRVVPLRLRVFCDRKTAIMDAHTGLGRGPGAAEDRTYNRRSQS